MSDEDLIELDELVSEWADAASKDDVDEDLLALDTLADEWANKDGALDLDEAEAALSDDRSDLEDSVEEDWAGRAAAAIPEPPEPGEPVTLPQRPAPVMLPPLPEDDLSDAAKRGDSRYATPIETPLPTPKPIAASTSTTKSGSKPAEKDNTAAGLVGAGIIAGGAAVSTAAGAMTARSVEPDATGPKPEPEPAKPSKPMPLAPAASKPVAKPAGQRTVHVPEDDEPVWRRWLPFGLVAGAGVTWLAIMAMTGQGSIDESAPPRVIEKASRIDPGAPVRTASTQSSEPEQIAETATSQPVTAGSPRSETPTVETTLTPDITPPEASSRTDTDPVIQDAPVIETPEAETVASEDIAVEPALPQPDQIETAGEVDTAPTETTPEIDATKPIERADEPTTEVAETGPEISAAPEPENVSGDPTPLETAKADIPEAAPVTAPERPTLKPAGKPTTPRKLVAKPSGPPSLKPVSINRSVELSRPRTTTTARTVTRTIAPAPQRTVRTQPARVSSTYQSVVTRSALQPITAIELLHDSAARGARSLSTPTATSSFNASIKRALLLGADGQTSALRTPDGRLLALKIETTRDEQLRSVLIPRAQEVLPPPTNLVLEESWTRTADRAGLRARPSEGPAIQTLERGTLLEVIGRVKDTDWRLVGLNGRAVGYLRNSELMFATERADTRFTNGDTQAIAFDVSRVRTRCRTAQYAIENGGASGGFTACRVYGGEWVLERGGDLTALSPGRLVFKR